MTESERRLWTRHLELKDLISSACLKGRFKEAQKLEAELQSLEDRIFSRWRQAPKTKRVEEKFSYRIPVIDLESGRPLGHKVADQDGVHDPAGLSSVLPTNRAGREWLRPVEPTKAIREKATLTWRTLGHSGRPACPGCRKRKDLLFLEFRNWDDPARFKIAHALAVCPDTASRLLERARKEIFSVTALGRAVRFPCVEPAEAPAPLSEGGSIKRTLRHPNRNLAAMAKARAALALKRRSRTAG